MLWAICIIAALNLFLAIFMAGLLSHACGFFTQESNLMEQRLSGLQDLNSKFDKIIQGLSQ